MMKLADREHELLKKAIAAFHDETGMELGVIEEQVRIEGQTIDTIIQLPNDLGKLAVAVKHWAQQINLGVLVEQIERLPIRGILAADYINPNMAERLKARNVQFIDTVGNAYINQLPVYVYVTANKQHGKLTTTKETHRAFDATGLKVVFAFLNDLELVNGTYREIAEKTGVALGTVGWVINGLKEAGFVIERGKKRRLANKQKLLDRWVEAYPEKLKPRLLVGEFIAEQPYWWEDVDISQYAAYWSGEVAAAKYTNYLKPQIATLYLPEPATKPFLANTRLRKAVEWTDRQNRVKIYRPFWYADANNKTDVVPDLAPPILVYADLIATADTRNLETARMIYEKYIAQHIREDG